MNRLLMIIVCEKGSTRSGNERWTPNSQEENNVKYIDFWYPS